MKDLRSHPQITDDELLNWFSYHPPTSPADVERYQKIREAGRVFATVIRDACPSSPDTTVAIRHVREAVMVANSAIACNSPFG